MHSNRPFAQLWPGSEVRGIASWNRLRCMCFSFELSFLFCFGTFFWRYTTPPFLKYSFRRVMLQLEFRESKCKREGSHLEQSWRHTGGVHVVYMRGDNLIYRHLPFKKLGFFAVQLWPLFFFSSTFSDEQCSNLSLDDPNPMNRTRNSPKRRQENQLSARQKHWNHMQVTDRLSPNAPSLTQTIFVQMVYLQFNSPVFFFVFFLCQIPMNVCMIVRCEYILCSRRTYGTLFTLFPFLSFSICSLSLSLSLFLFLSPPALVNFMLSENVQTSMRR